jgi:hypothetical protein
MLMDERDTESEYERWKFAGSSIPFRYSLGGLFAVVLAGMATWDEWWNSAYRATGLAAGLLLLIGSAALFYDVPRRRLGLVSKTFLGVGFVVLGVLTIFRILSR